MSRRPNGNGFDDPRVVPFRRPAPKKPKRPLGSGWQRVVGLFLGSLALAFVLGLLLNWSDFSLAGLIVPLAFAVVITVTDMIQRRRG
ncbi:hypothetical protein [Sphingomonas sp.]|uniref:hypothetical protein n=1 Tax=Sphingomonas sp. TaxID=28214 RepID=UPI001B17FC9C|nr:hypothetical protein [Sphingomonas sp.]MBO9711862.1 hypothetical protein [Sphingomonas sp.]